MNSFRDVQGLLKGKVVNAPQTQRDKLERNRLRLYQASLIREDILGTPCLGVPRICICLWTVKPGLAQIAKSLTSLSQKIFLRKNTISARNWAGKKFVGQVTGCDYNPRAS
jgi:hypothetical protein